MNFVLIYSLIIYIINHITNWISVKVKSRIETLNDVITEAKKHPLGWKGVIGKDNNRLSNDYYLFNPKSGIYLLKEYQKNPYELKGVGGKIARYVDEDVENEISKYAKDFGIIQSDIKKISTNIQKGIPIQKIFKAAIEGKDRGISMPMKGQASASEDSFCSIQNTFSIKQKKIDTKFEKIATTDGLYKPYD